MKMLKVGSRVKAVNQTAHELNYGVYPPVGTLGTVEAIDRYDILVKWDSGVYNNGCWWCDLNQIEEVKPDDQDLYIDLALEQREQM
jgi:hypothetical protein